MNTIFGLVLPQPVVWVLSLLFVLVLAGIFFLILRRISGRRATLKGQGGARARQPRLGIIDIYDLDRQRQLVLLRRDNVEHLVMIGGPTDVVVETNILRGGVRPAAGPIQDGTTSDRLEGDMAYGAPAIPVPFAAAPLASPAVSAPVIAPSPVAAAPAAPVLASQEAGSSTPAAAPFVAAGATLGSAAVAASSAYSRATAAVQTDAPAAKVEIPAEADAFARTDSPVRTDIPARTESKPVFPLESAPAPKAPAADLDDMARQLEQALKRPFAAVRSSAPAAAAVVAAETILPEIKAPEIKIPEVKAPEMKAPEIKAPEIKIPELVSTPVEPSVPATSSFEAFMEEQLKAAVEAAPAVTAKMIEPVQEPAAKVLASAPQLPNSVAADLQAAMADTFKVVEPVKVSEPVQAAAAFKDKVIEVVARPEAAAKVSETMAPASSTAPSMDKAVEDKKAPEPVPTETVRPRSEMKPEPAASKTAEFGGKTDAGKPDEGKSPDQATSGPKPADGNEADPFSIDAIELEFARLLGRDTKPKT